MQYPRKPTKAFAIKKMPEKPVEPVIRVIDKNEKYIEKKPQENRPKA